jgi:predicted nucleic acid-binding protein
MPFVVDASVAACWLLPDETDHRADAAFDRFPTDTAFAPSLWWFEMRNIFLLSERRGRLNSVRTEQLLSLLNNLPIQIDRHTNETDLMTLARRHKLTAYGAAYLELALRQNLPLATLDAALMRAAKAEGVEVIGEAA